MSTLILSSTQQVEVHISPVDAKGHSAPVDGVPLWDTSNPGVAEVVPTSDGLGALIVAQGPGMTQVSVSVDTRMGEAVNLITGALDVTVTPAEAVAVAIVPGTPTEQ